MMEAPELVVLEAPELVDLEAPELVVLEAPELVDLEEWALLKVIQLTEKAGSDAYRIPPNLLGMVSAKSAGTE
ncbi:hypothetical protein [Shimia gijangensis]|uniref:hypothetical protein n=1 Tax=Shimia gijangensis TaxID=1470563 RepID=UPI001FE8BD76|nr:hypothetical protein [Shimia gijangensis]